MNARRKQEHKKSESDFMQPFRLSKKPKQINVFTQYLFSHLNFSLPKKANLTQKMQ